jgi:hypothetical protein
MEAGMLACHIPIIMQTMSVVSVVGAPQSTTTFAEQIKHFRDIDGALIHVENECVAQAAVGRLQ